MKFYDTLRSVKRAVGGIFALLKYGLTEERISLSISEFSTPSAAIRDGESGRYKLIVANNTPQDRRAKIRIDITLQENPTALLGHFASFEKVIFVKAGGNHVVKIGYDWGSTATFLAENVESPADHLERGLCQVRGRYLVNASLLTLEGNCYEKVSLTQQLAK